METKTTEHTEDLCVRANPSQEQSLVTSTPVSSSLGAATEWQLITCINWEVEEEQHRIQS